MKVKRIMLIFSHKIMEDQEKELKEKFGITEIISLNDECQKIWTDVYFKNKEKYFENLKKIKKYIKDNLDENDYALVQGEWGYTYNIVNYCIKNKIIPIYSFSKRESFEEITVDEVIKLSKFKHIEFLKYNDFNEE